MPSFKCRDVGLHCRFEAKAETEEELMEKIKEHARRAHNWEVSPEVVETVKKAIKK